MVYKQPKFSSVRVRPTFLSAFLGTFSALLVYSSFFGPINSPHTHHYISESQLQRPEFVQRPQNVVDLDLHPVAPQFDHVPIASKNSHSSQPPAKYCDQSHTCIFDLGFNTGQDTHFYLRDPNVRVVAVEANPLLVDEALRQEPYKSAVATDRLRLLSVGISANRDAGNLTFWVNDYNEYSSFIERVGCRKVGYGEMPEGNHTYCRPINVPTINCAELLERYGTPDYMKIDIEGLQGACLGRVADMNLEQRPKYISVEGVGQPTLNVFAKLGYNSFKIVNQKVVQRTHDGLRGNSGPWGEDAEDFFVAKKWESLQEVLGRLPINVTTDGHGTDWFDLHARKGSA